MNNREAKKLAVRSVADLIRSDISAGEEWILQDEHGYYLSDADARRVTNALPQPSPRADRTAAMFADDAIDSPGGV